MPRAVEWLFALVLGVTLAPVIVLVALAVLVVEGRPIFYLSKRMKTPNLSFGLIKFRTMSVTQEEVGVTGGDKAHRISAFGGFLRQSRLDEIPQLWNILRGDMGFVGSRPQSPRYVKRHKKAYTQLLIHRPGLTGLGTLLCVRREGRILAKCRTPHQTEQMYERYCLQPRNQADTLYAANRTFLSDIYVLMATGLRFLPASPRPRRWMRRVRIRCRNCMFKLLSVARFVGRIRQFSPY